MYAVMYVCQATHCVVAPLVRIQCVVDVWRDHDGLEALRDGCGKTLRHALLKPATHTTKSCSVLVMQGKCCTGDAHVRV
jgi:hypothetical protein